MFDFTDEGWFDAFVHLAQRRHYPVDDIIHHAGDPVSKLCLVVSGQVEIWHTSNDGKEIWLGTCHPGDVLGSFALISDELSNFDWVALSNVALLSISPSAFETLQQSHPDMMKTLYARLSAVLNATRRAFILAQTENARGRIYHELLRLSDIIGREPDKRVIRPSPIFADMARRANTTRETVSRTVSQLCKSGVLQREPGALVLNEPAQLERN